MPFGTVFLWTFVTQPMLHSIHLLRWYLFKSLREQCSQRFWQFVKMLSIKAPIHPACISLLSVWSSQQMSSLCCRKDHFMLLTLILCHVCSSHLVGFGFRPTRKRSDWTGAHSWTKPSSTFAPGTTMPQNRTKAGNRIAAMFNLIEET